MDDTTNTDSRTSDDRRGWIKKTTAVVVGGLTAMVPLVSGLIVFLDPLRRRGEAGLARVAPIEGVPDDGLPRMFPIVLERSDAWSRYPKAPIGAVYLIRQPGEAAPVAFTARCPHLGCSIGFLPGEQRFQCPCHTSAFDISGSRIDGEDSVAPRGMDTLDVEIRDGAVWVKFEKFYTGRHEKIAEA